MCLHTALMRTCCAFVCFFVFHLLKFAPLFHRTSVKWEFAHMQVHVHGVIAHFMNHHIAIAFRSFIHLTQRNCLPLGEMRLVPRGFGKGISAITAITIGKGELHCHSTNSKRDGVNSLCTMHYCTM